MKSKCTESGHGRIVHRSFHADYLETVRGYHETEAYQKAMRKRQVWVEPIFAEAKVWHGMRRFRLRRLWRVSTEALMIASVQNLKRLLNPPRSGRTPASGMAAPAPHRQGASSQLVRILSVAFEAMEVLMARSSAAVPPHSAL